MRKTVKPMIFNQQMVKALVDGRKTVTRRPLKVQPEDSGRGYMWIPSKTHGSMIQVLNIDEIACDYKRDFVEGFLREACPFGNIGDLIWVRETFRLFDSSTECGCSESPCNCPSSGSPIYRAMGCDTGEETWKPSIHMPRWASRLTLRVTDVRVERVQDITEEDAKKEGSRRQIWFMPHGKPEDEHRSIKNGFDLSYTDGFATIWDSIYKNWDENPWVWVIEFEVIHKNVDEVIKCVKQ